ncbi:MAG: F0F1 ATP synthase subunit delta [Alphaproteobacteria bacterium]|nr:F0F1 ATP synthase subunit delta [Alphaproteobacteria bacterium]
MIIDWFTVGAQVLNFLVLVWLLKRFLYQPILNAIDKREKRIAESLADAANSKAQAAAERDRLQGKHDAFDKERADLLAKAVEAAQTERKRLIDAAHKAAEDLSDKQRKALASDAKALSAEISRRAETEVFAIARKALTDMADASLEERMSERFIAKLSELKGSAKTTLAKMLESTKEPVVLRSAFDLPSKQKAAIQKAITETFKHKIDLTFETAPEVVSGIEMMVGGQKLAWSLSDYLKSLESSVSALMKPDSMKESKVAHEGRS